MTPRGFSDEEFRMRAAKAQDLMKRHGLGALLLTTEPEIRYYTGFLTRFWESPTRPWFVVLPADGDPVAVIPSIGAHLMGQSWVRDIRTWAAPDYEDDGVCLLADTICEVSDGPVGMADRMETYLRMPQRDFERLKGMIAHPVVSDHGITAQLRQIKSDAEISKIRQAAMIANRAFDRVPDIAGQGVPLSEVFRKFQMVCLEEGADWVPYLAGAAEQGGYGDVISPATDIPLKEQDVLMLDTGLVWDGYFCDFDRNYSVGVPSADVSDAHARLIDATQAAFDATRIGAKISDLFHVMSNILQSGSEGGRLGHGLGMQLTEGVSIIAADHTPLQAGMVLTLEPCLTLPNGKIMVHEENIVLTETGPVWLSEPQVAEIRTL